VGEREKEKEPDARMKAGAIQDALDGGKAMADISADERFYNRSVRIRRKVMKWLLENVNESFDTLGDMEAMCGNYAGCSMPTARRWIFQWTRPGKPFMVEERTDLYIIRERKE
jgi:hypothetical protein